MDCKGKAAAKNQKSLHFYLAKKLNTNKHYLRTSFILASSNRLTAKGKRPEELQLIEQLYAL